MAGKLFGLGIAGIVFGICLILVLILLGDAFPGQIYILFVATLLVSGGGSVVYFIGVATGYSFLSDPKKSEPTDTQNDNHEG
jgi:hypothetical protein